MTHPFPYPLGEKSIGANERCIEYPWVLNRILPGSSVLDVGTVAPPFMSGHEQFLFYLKRTLRCRYVSLDIMPGADIHADIQTVELFPKSFDTVVAISTLEHIHDHDAALANMARLGRQVLLTLPYGFPHTMPWGKQYGDKDLCWLLVDGMYEVLEKEFFEYQDGWQESTAEKLGSRAYYSGGASDAAGVVCVHLKEVCDE